MSGPAAARRSVVLGLAAAALGWATAGSAQTLGPSPGATRLSSIVVDVGVLRARGLDAGTDLLKRALEVELRRAFAERLGGAGPRLVVRITGLSLNAYAGGGQGGSSAFGNATNTDYLEGEALLVGMQGEILASYPQLSAVPASSGGAYYLPGAEERRVIALAQHFAGWLKRRIL